MSAEGGGIYAIVNRITGHRYVGQSKHLRRREREHFKALAEGAHHCRRLQRAFAKYGQDAFGFEVLEHAPVERLDELEQGYLDAGFAAGTLYNTATCAEAPARGVKRSPEFCASNGARKRVFFSDPAERQANARRIAAALADPAVRAKMRTRRSEAGREAISVAQRRRFSTAEGRAALKASLEKRSPEWRAGSVSRGRSWRSNPGWVEKFEAGIVRRSEDQNWRSQIAERNRSDGMRRAVKDFWASLKADPIAYAAFMAKRSASRMARR